MSTPLLAPSASESVLGVTLDQVIDLAIQKEASDIHFAEAGRVALRVGGKFVFVDNITRLSAQDAEAMIRQMIDENQYRKFSASREFDFSYIHSSGVSFRVNLFYAQGKLSAVMRMVTRHALSMEELGLPEILKSFLSLRQGIILITGRAGSGKSTTIQSLLYYLNQNFAHHIITIENPIEHIFKEEQSIFSQREVGKDTLSFPSAIRSASREDPNVVMVSEVANHETFDAMLELSEMGHLVVAALPTKNVHQTLEHLISFYPESKQAVMQDRFADNLLAILSQDLLERLDQPGRIAVYELLVGTTAAKNIVRHAVLPQLRTVMESEMAQGMIPMDKYAHQLLEKGFISAQDASQFLVQTVE